VAQEFLLRPRRREPRLGCHLRLPRRAQPRPGRPRLGHKRFQPAESIEQGAVHPGVQKPPVVLLAMKFHQGIRERAHHLARGAAIVDPCGLAPVGPVYPAQDQLLATRQTGFGQNVMRWVPRREIEYRQYLAFLRARAHEIGAPAPAEHETETVEQDGLTRPGFAGEHVEARLELQFQPVDDQHVSNIEGAQHYGCLPRRPRATRP